MVLAKDIPEHQLKTGDIGAVVGCYGAEVVEVEFLSGSDRTIAVVTVQSRLVRDKSIAGRYRPDVDLRILVLTTL